MVADALFGLVLAGLLAARFRIWLKYSPPASTADIRRFSRQLSRTVYLALYLIIGAKELLDLAGLEPGAASDGDFGMLKPTSQVFLAYGLMALVLVRVGAYLTWRRYRSSLQGHGPATAAGDAAPPLLRPVP
jgi:cytochrome b561